MRSVILALLAFSSLSVFADDGEAIAQAKCLKCHSSDSQDIALGAQTPEYLFQTMKDYQSGVRHSDGAAMMVKRVRFDDETLRNVSLYYSKLPAPTPVAGDAKLIAMGKSIYESGIPSKNVKSCSECHGRDGEGRGFGDGLNPRLAGQNKDFQIMQLQNYKDGNINNQKEMTEIASKLSTEEMNAVSTYMLSK